LAAWIARLHFSSASFRSVWYSRWFMRSPALYVVEHGSTARGLDARGMFEYFLTTS
jgi:hypothetical protein